LIIKSSGSWKSEEIGAEIKSCINLENVSYSVSDNGNNIKGCYELTGLLHIEDIGHKFSWFMKQVFESYPDFEGYTKHLSGLRGKLPLSKFAHLIPPNQRIISRFMNLTPLFNWGCKVLRLLDNNLLNAEEKEKVGFVLQYRTFILQTNHLLSVLNSVQQTLKIKHLSNVTKKACLRKLSEIQDKKGKEVTKMVKEYFENTLCKLPKDKKILCCSDIIESCFGKYKEVVKSNKSVGVTDLCLTISCLTSFHDFQNTKNSLEKVKVKQINEWRSKNIGESLLAKRNKLFRKVG